MVCAAVIGAVAVLVGLTASWYAGTAAGASIACAAILTAVVSGLLRSGLDLLRRLAPTSERNPCTAEHSPASSAPSQG